MKLFAKHSVKNGRLWWALQKSSGVDGKIWTNLHKFATMGCKYFSIEKVFILKFTDSKHIGICKGLKIALESIND